MLHVLRVSHRTQLTITFPRHNTETKRDNSAKQGTFKETIEETRRTGIAIICGCRERCVGWYESPTSTGTHVSFIKFSPHAARACSSPRSIVVLIELNALDPPLSHALTARGLSYLFATLNSRLVIEISYDRPANIHFYSLGLFFCCYSL